MLNTCARTLLVLSFLTRNKTPPTPQLAISTQSAGVRISYSAANSSFCFLCCRLSSMTSLDCTSPRHIPSSLPLSNSVPTFPQCLSSLFLKFSAYLPLSLKFTAYLPLSQIQCLPLSLSLSLSGSVSSVASYSLTSMDKLALEN